MLCPPFWLPAGFALSLMSLLSLSAKSISYKILYLSAGIMCAIGLAFTSSSITYLLEWQVTILGAVPVNFVLILDHMGTLYRSVVLFIAGNVMLFSKFYMSDDKFIDRFSVLVILFVISINLLIFIPRLIILLLGWDGLGITSFILIVYYQNPKSLAAGMITALTNRVGDVIILVAIGLSLNQGHWTSCLIWEKTHLVLLSLLLIVAAITKSAQIPFSSWLPAAMAAPTPVSALVHSSTLVTAGVFLIIRFYPFLRSSLIFRKLLLFSAVITITIAGIRASTECDIKKIIALSTLSQLGVIIAALGLGLPEFALFHIMAHALFKALLFICAGQLITLHSHSQELRWMGDLVSQTPVASSCIFIANSALCGLPFLAGFYSKDIILEAILCGHFNFLIVSISLIAVGFTSLYSVRFRLIIIWGPRNTGPLSNLSEDRAVLIPILLISLTSVFGGRLIRWIIPSLEGTEVMPTLLKLRPTIIVVVGGSIGWFLLSYKNSSGTPTMTLHLSNYASCKIWFLVPLASQLPLRGPFLIRHLLIKNSDQGWLDQCGGMRIRKFLTTTGASVLTFRPKSPRSVVLSTSIICLSLISITYLMCLNSLNIKPAIEAVMMDFPFKHCLWCK